MDERKGYILLSRKITSSDIFNKPPLYLKVWIYLLSHAQYNNYKGLKKGQLWVSIDKIREDCSYFKGYIKVTPTRDEVYPIIEWLRSAHEAQREADTKETMITTTKATRGLVINIENYAYYQDPKNYEDNNEGDDEKATKKTRKGNSPSTIKETNKEINKKNKNKYIVEKAIAYLNIQTNHQYKITDANSKHIIARLNDGYTLKQILQVIHNKVLEWEDDPVMKKFLRPETLFGSKFDTYLNFDKERSGYRTHAEMAEIINLDTMHLFSLTGPWDCDIEEGVSK